MNNDIVNDDNWWTRTRFVVKIDTYKGQSYYEEIIEDWLENYCFSKYIKKEQGRKSRYYLGLTIYNFWFNYYFENDELIIEAWQINQRLASFTATPYINLLHTLLDFEEYNDENNRNIATLKENIDYSFYDNQRNAKKKIWLWVLGFLLLCIVFSTILL